jgi:GNAT superfamily N-acetyltransferase
VAQEGNDLIGYIAGHLTRRFGCAGELQWIYVSPPRRRGGVASRLLRCLAEWFKQQQETWVCVNVATSNTAAHAFYARNGAEVMNQHWLVWENIAAVPEYTHTVSGRPRTGLR